VLSIAGKDSKSRRHTTDQASPHCQSHHQQHIPLPGAPALCTYNLLYITATDPPFMYICIHTATTNAQFCCQQLLVKTISELFCGISARKTGAAKTVKVRCHTAWHH